MPGSAGTRAPNRSWGGYACYGRHRIAQDSPPPPPGSSKRILGQSPPGSYALASPHPPPQPLPPNVPDGARPPDCPVFEAWAAQGMDLVVGTSYGHQYCMAYLAPKYPRHTTTSGLTFPPFWTLTALTGVWVALASTDIVCFRSDWNISTLPPPATKLHINFLPLPVPPFCPRSCHRCRFGMLGSCHPARSWSI